MTFQKVKYQVLACCLANLYSLGVATGFSWLSPNLRVLLSETETPLSNGPLTIDQIAWLGSMSPIGSLFGIFFYGWICKLIGFRKTLLFQSIPLAVAWILIIFGTNIWYVLSARFLMGFSVGGCVLCMPQYTAEISNPEIRGQLSIIFQIFYQFGFLFSYVSGGHINYLTNAIVLLAIPVIFFTLFSLFIPDTPQYLIKTNQIENAKLSYKFYKNMNENSVDEDLKLQEEFKKYNEIAQQIEVNQNLKFSDFFTPEARKAICLGTIIMVLLQCSGLFSVCAYAEYIFNGSGSTINSNMSSIVMVMAQLIGTIIASQLIDKIGRKILYITSCALASMSICITGIFVHLATNGIDVSSFNLIPMFSISLYLLSTSVGILPVPVVLLAEIFSPKLRKDGSMICTFLTFSMQGIIFQSLPFMKQFWGLEYVLFMFGGFCGFGVLFGIFFVPETKGKNLHVINNKETNGNGNLDKIANN